MRGKRSVIELTIASQPPPMWEGVSGGQRSAFRSLVSLPL